MVSWHHDDGVHEEDESSDDEHRHEEESRPGVDGEKDDGEDDHEHGCCDQGLPRRLRVDLFHRLQVDFHFPSPLVGYGLGCFCFRIHLSTKRREEQTGGTYYCV